jgi:hypothetical protein
MNRIILIGAMALAVLTGCVTNPAPPVVQCKFPMKGARPGAALVSQEYGPQMTPIPLNSVQFSDWSIARSLAVQHLFASRTPTDTVQVVARLVSCVDRELTVKVRTSFLDANQAPVEGTSAWQTVYLTPRLTATYSERSTSKGVASYLIEVTPQ